MTPLDVSRATGISPGTVYRHLHNGYLDGTWNGSRWHIPRDEALSWAEWMRAHRSCAMYPQDYIARYIERFGLT